MKLVVVDYGMGNISSIVGALDYLGQKNVLVSNEKTELETCDKLILPGVGNFSMAMGKIREQKLGEQIKRLVVDNHRPILGICLGMQLLGFSSEENGLNSGLGLINGTVGKFEKSELKVPHVGYNQVKAHPESRLYKHIEPLSDFYFTHSYKMKTSEEIGQSHCTYGEEFVASFELSNIAGVQFHPELSQMNGLQLLRNFIELF